ncbi:hypothetical protein CEP54_006647 [Fusarium duplospermum]|uniref:Uncharacterized protein n=1 Tax=Fusarium duplospermum TaxID=1325734 RepID=A0A428Q5S4_9HYPO|nr:hypothetical protein CEP54_006647 [Fusarium duplospermum]
MLLQIIEERNTAEDVLFSARNAPIDVKRSHKAVRQTPKPLKGQTTGDHQTDQDGRTRAEA